RDKLVTGVQTCALPILHVPARAGRPAARLSRSGTGPAVDGHEADARLNKPPGQQQVLPQGVTAVAVAHTRVFPLDVKRLARPRRSEERRGERGALRVVR